MLGRPPDVPAIAITSLCLAAGLAAGKPEPGLLLSLPPATDNGPRPEVRPSNTHTQKKLVARPR
ncbi:hypothetical protein GCM10010313_82150 [Streptomyces violarus]|nr:hypothetical protein GCM10010313_82150 [Streptomyces violarus]